MHQVIEFQRQRCFAGFADSISTDRRAGDASNDQKVKGEVAKSTGNQGYGSLLLDKTKWTDTSYVQGLDNARKQVNQALFRGLTCLDEEKQFYEVSSAKSRIRLDLPIQLAFFVLQLAKLRMLMYQFDFLDIYVDRSDYMLLEMDTDSSYIALSKPSLAEVIKPEMLNEYNRGLTGFCSNDPVIPDTEYHWFPRTCCDKHKAYDKRLPGVFKTEFTGDKMISLCSKTYIVEGPDGTKMSSKGTNTPDTLADVYSKYEKVLDNREPVYCENTGIRLNKNELYTYRQRKIGFQYLYVKRRVASDGVSTFPLDITLKPLTNRSLKQAYSEEEEDISDEELLEALVEMYN